MFSSQLRFNNKGLLPDSSACFVTFSYSPKKETTVLFDHGNNVLKPCLMYSTDGNSTHILALALSCLWCCKCENCTFSPVMYVPNHVSAGRSLRHEVWILIRDLWMDGCHPAGVNLIASFWPLRLLALVVS